MKNSVQTVDIVKQTSQHINKQRLVNTNKNKTKAKNIAIATTMASVKMAKQWKKLKNNKHAHTQTQQWQCYDSNGNSTDQQHKIWIDIHFPGYAVCYHALYCMNMNIDCVEIFHRDHKSGLKSNKLRICGFVHMCVCVCILFFSRSNPYLPPTFLGQTASLYTSKSFCNVHNVKTIQMSCECIRSGYFTVTLALRFNEVHQCRFCSAVQDSFFSHIVVEKILSLFYKTNIHSKIY